jgi:transcription antitermination factor NusG
MTKNEKDKKWYALYTKSNYEKRVNDILRKRGVNTFFPMRKVKSKIAGNYRLVEVPLFKGYIFINISLQSKEHFEVLKTTGVSYIVSREKQACPVPSSIIEALQIMVEKMGESISVVSGLKSGERVRIAKGPLRNAVGEMVRIDQRKYLFVVNMTILGRAVEVSISPDYVTRI